jgi:hypothetical protein
LVPHGAAHAARSDCRLSIVRSAVHDRACARKSRRVSLNAPFRFIHASDFHLDRPPRGLVEVPEHLRPALVDAPYRAAERVFDAAIKENVDFVVLAGDLLDPAMAGPRGLVFLGEQFRRLAQRGIGIYWALGRGDRFDALAGSWPLPDGVVQFAEESVERVVHCRGDEPVAQILGTSTQKRKKIRLSDFRTSGGGLFAVAVAHGSADPQLLARRGIDYWALGGEHQRRAVLGEGPLAHYCGSPQGRRPQESGAHGCTLVQVDETGRARTVFVPTDAVRYLDEQVAVNESATAEQLHQVLAERVGELAGDPFGPDLLVCWTIVGSKAISAQLRHGRLAADLVARLRSDHALARPSVWTIALEGEPPGGIPPERFEEETLLGEFLRTVRHYDDNPHEPLDLARYLSARHAEGSLAAAVALDDTTARKRVLAEVARLGASLLSPQEARPSQEARP